MFHRIDRRLNPKDKSLGNRQRFLRRAKAEIREAVRESLRKRKVSDVDGGEDVRIRSKSLREPTFGLGREQGERDYVLPGNKEFSPGDVIRKPESGRGGRGNKGEAWRQIVEGHDGEEGFGPKLVRMWREQDYLRPAVRIGYFPCNSDGNELVIFDPDDHDTELERFVFPRQPKHDRICLADFYRPISSDERDLVALQGVTVGSEVTERITQLEREGEFAEQLFVHGLGVQAAEGLAEWSHAEARAAIGIEPGQGRRYSWGYPACPDQSEHTKLWRLLELERIGMSLSEGYAVEPEQSTVAIIAHHPEAVYFGMKSGFIPADSKPDELIAGTDRGGDLPPDEDFEGDGSVQSEEESLI